MTSNRAKQEKLGFGKQIIKKEEEEEENITLKIQKFSEMWWHIPVSPATQEAELGGSWYQASLSKVSRQDPI
jgi:hypothetical protein